ncbi:Hypothetical predicted protein, partial [Mytilus galloprovincialis]
CGKICLSCNGVETVKECLDVEICRDDEVCFTQKYQTLRKQELYDFGCSLHQYCLSGSSGSIFGKRRTGRHILCHTCCNSTNVCNIKSACEPDTSSSHEIKDSNLPRECDDLVNSTSGVYTIYPDGLHPVQVYCIMANNEKWTVIQRRFNGYVSFDRTWDQYKRGFGSVSGEYWLGNENIHQISSSTGHKLSIYLEDFTGKFAYANYSVFDLGDEQRKYQLSINEFSGTSGLRDYLNYHNTQMFTTKDQDNDVYGYNCAAYEGGNGGWWYRRCLSSNLNGPYMAGPVHNQTAFVWANWPSSYYSLKKSSMMIKRYFERP